MYVHALFKPLKKFPYREARWPAPTLFTSVLAMREVTHTVLSSRQLVSMRQYIYACACAYSCPIQTSLQQYRCTQQLPVISQQLAAIASAVRPKHRLNESVVLCFTSIRDGTLSGCLGDWRSFRCVQQAKNSSGPALLEPLRA